MDIGRFNLCTKSFGRDLIAHGLPSVTLYPTAIVQHNSLYTTYGGLIENSTYCAGATVSGAFDYRVFAPRQINLTPVRVTGPSNGFWLGYFHEHFGYFLTSTLQRLWSLGAMQSDRTTLVASNFTPERPHHGFMTDIFDALKIDIRRITGTHDDALLSTVTVAEPAFVENSHAYPLWTDFMHGLKVTLIGKPVGRTKNTPISFSRDRLYGGTRRYKGEDILVDTLHNIGIDICHPEELTPQQQLALWDSNTIFIGFVGSAFMNAAFNRGKTLILLAHDDYIFGTQRLIDKLGKNRTFYLNASAYLDKSSQHTDTDTYTITDPAALAADLIRFIRSID